MVLKKINRGLQRKDFGEILTEGKTIQTPLFGVRYQSLPPLRGDLSLKGTQKPLTREVEQSRFGWIISKKISTRAVDRNKIKRRLAEMIGKQIKNYELRITNGKIIFLVKKLMLTATIGEIETQVKYVFEKIGFKNTSSL